MDIDHGRLALSTNRICSPDSRRVMWMNLYVAQVVGPTGKEFARYFVRAVTRDDAVHQATQAFHALFHDKLMNEYQIEIFEKNIATDNL